MRAQDRFSMPRTFLLGSGFLGVSIIWSMYNAYVPVFLKESFGLPSTVIGLIMTIDNVFAIVLLPFLGALSDRAGALIDVFGYPSLMYFSAALFLLAILVVGLVRRGEAVAQEVP